jgi:hypothetical protein
VSPRESRDRGVATAPRGSRDFYVGDQPTSSASVAIVVSNGSIVETSAQIALGRSAARSPSSLPVVDSTPRCSSGR